VFFAVNNISITKRFIIKCKTKFLYNCSSISSRSGSISSRSGSISSSNSSSNSSINSSSSSSGSNGSSSISIIINF